MIDRGNTFPGGAFVARAVHAAERAGQQQLRIRRRLRQRSHGLVRQSNNVPGMPAVAAAVHAAAARIQRPGARVESFRIARVHDDVRNYVILPGADAAQ